MPEIVEHISLVIDMIGVTVILWGVLLGVLHLLRLEWAGLSGRDVKICGMTSGCTPETADTCTGQVSSAAMTMRGGRKLSPFLQRGADDRPFLP